MMRVKEVESFWGMMEKNKDKWSDDMREWLGEMEVEKFVKMMEDMIELVWNKIEGREM